VRGGFWKQVIKNWLNSQMIQEITQYVFSIFASFDIIPPLIINLKEAKLLFLKTLSQKDNLQSKSPQFAWSRTKYYRK